MQEKRGIPDVNEIKAFFRDFSFKKMKLPTVDFLPFIGKSGAHAGAQPKKVRRKVKRKVSMAY